MKKLLFLLLIAPMIGNSQMLNLPVSNIIVKQGFTLVEHTIPAGKAWPWIGISTSSKEDVSDYSSINWQNHFGGYVEKYHIFKEGQNLGIGWQQSNLSSGRDCQDCYFTFIEYDLTAQNLAINMPQQTKPTLYPNPTSSLLALNSDKEYHIEVFDMKGNIVMALKGNTIDMSHLSSATYIVKALDKLENKEVSYKVVKN